MCEGYFTHNFLVPLACYCVRSKTFLSVQKNASVIFEGSKFLEQIVSIGIYREGNVLSGHLKQHQVLTNLWMLASKILNLELYLTIVNVYIINIFWGCVLFCFDKF